MPYRKQKFTLDKPIRAYEFLMKNFDLNMKEAQRWIDRFRLYQHGICMKEKNKKLFGEVQVVVYEPQSRGLKPVFVEEDFVIFDKPSGLLVHPTSRDCEYCLFDEILSDFGKNAHIVHRLDRQTSGLIIVAKNKLAEAKLKMLFEKRKVQKSYIALARGLVNKTLNIDAALKNNYDYENIKLKMLVDESGKQSITEVEPMEYFSDIDATLVKVFPKTGRQHQIRVHLFHVKHSIIGDTLYGTSTQNAKDYLDKKLDDEACFRIFGAKRLLLHAQSLEFEYENRLYKFESKKDIQRQFYNLAKGKDEDDKI